MKTARQITLDLLIRMDTQGAYSNIILDHAFTQNDADRRDKAFSAALFYGVLERRMTLDYLIRYYSGIEFDKIKTAVVEILRMGFRAGQRCGERIGGTLRLLQQYKGKRLC